MRQLQENERLDWTCLRTWEDNYVKTMPGIRGSRSGEKNYTRCPNPPPPPPMHFPLFSGRIHLPRDTERQLVLRNEVFRSTAGRPGRLVTRWWHTVDVN
jgi:hypothetical protein